MKRKILSFILILTLVFSSAVPVFAAETAAVKGDADGDGEIKALDARLILRAALQLENLSAEMQALADIDGDRRITAVDARFALRAVVGLETLPGEASHTPGKAVKENEKPASCKIPGYYDEVIYCETCHKELSRERIYVPAQEHQLENIPAKSPTCVNPGNNEYFYCRTCDKYFKLTENITPEDFTVISSCYFNDGSVISDSRVSAESADSSFIKGTELILSDNTLTVNLKNCRGLIADELTIYYNPDAVSVSKVRPGTDRTSLILSSSANIYNTESNYKYIPGTIKIAGYFRDSLDGNWEIDSDPINNDFFNTDKIILTVRPHYVETTPEKETLAATGEHIAAVRTENEVPSTCKAAGHYDKVTYCTVCNTELSRETVELPLKEHTAEIISAVAATCTSTGLTEGKKCSVCGEILVSQEVTEMLPHTPAAAVKENEVPSTCTKAGSYDEVIYCSVCKAEISRKTVNLPEAAHKFGDWTITEATYMNEGKKERTCSVCGKTETDIIPMLQAEKEIKTEDGKISLKHENNVIKADVKLNAEEKSKGGAFEILSKEKGRFSRQLYDITLSDSKGKVQPDGLVLVCIPLPEGYNAETTFVYYVSEKDGSLVKMNSYVKDGVVCFETDHFSSYAIVDESSKPGDADGDGQITAADARHVLRASVGLEADTEELRSIADMNKDGKITAADARTILRKSVGLD